MTGSKTEKNVLAAFAGESQARTRYSFFASIAKKEGFEQISGIFLETSDNEMEHAKLFFGLLKGGTVDIASSYPSGVLGTTAQNLKASAEGEKFEWGTLYPGFADTAESEGLVEAAGTFRRIARVEASHERRYRKLLADMEQGIVFKRASVVPWKCRNCGYVHEGTGAPERCPVCDHPQSYFELWCENY
jgi:rubrerythrin